MKRKILILFAAFIVMLALPAVANAQIIDSGECGADGDNVTWALDDAGTLTISGEGEIMDFTYVDPPWRDSNIKKVVIDQSVTTIGDYAFYNCEDLTSVIIPNSVTKICRGAFSYCGLTSVIIPDSITSINYSVFSNCHSLTSVIIPNTVTNIGFWAFSSCDSLTSVTIPNSVTNIDGFAFSGCGSLNISVDQNNTSYCDIDGVLFNKSKSEIISYSKDKIQPDYSIPDSVTSIGDYAFSKCTSLTSITIPDSVTNIGDTAFDHCSGLTSVTIPDSVTNIGDSVFVGCSGLTSLTIPDSVTSIADHAFLGCTSLTDVYYTGSKADWNQIAIGEYNQHLLDATIHYNYIKYDPITPAALTVVPSGGGYVLTADTEYDGAAYAASYDAEGRLLNVVSKPFTGGTATVTPDTTGAAKIKFFVWTNNIQPVTNVEVMDL